MKESMGDRAGGADPADRELARLVRGALARERTPESWVADALAMAKGAEIPDAVAWRDRAGSARAGSTVAAGIPRADAWVPAIASGALLAGFGAALFAARHPMSALLGEFTRPAGLLPGVAGSAASGLGGLHPLAIVALAILPPAAAFALAESVRGFPLLRRWFA